MLAVSDVDRDTLQQALSAKPHGAGRVIPTGVDTAYFARLQWIRRVGARLIFTGSMDWLPNVDGVEFFCREILPLDPAKRNPTSRSRSSDARRRRPCDGSPRHRGVEVTGRVEDVRPYLADAAVYVVPLRIGGGTRLKIFEAMAAGRAVVSTSVGAEGLPTENGRHLLLADDPGGVRAGRS